jgi:hypothetical protein
MKQLFEEVAKAAKKQQEAEAKAAQDKATATLIEVQSKIYDNTSALLDDLRVVGNNAAHGDYVDFTKDDAMRFRELVDRANNALNAAANAEPH